MKLTIRELTKQYGTKTALNKLNLELNNGIYALLGPNGAGKTTFINMLVGVLHPTSGEILCDGKLISNCEREYLGQIGYLPQNPSFYKQFTAEEFLKYMCLLKDIPKDEISLRVDRLLEEVNLSDVRKKKIGSFSGGMKQRIGIAQTLINNPSLLILDEPTAGLDPKERIRFRNILSKLSRNRIIILATHIVSDVEYLANRVILLKDGVLIAEKKPAELLEEIKEKVWSLSVKEEDLENYINTFGVSSATFEDGLYRLHLVSKEQPSDEAVPAPPTLNDVYLDCFGEDGTV